MAGLKESRPEWFGITGANDQVAIQTAQNSIAATGGTVIFRAGVTYNVTPAYLEDDYNHSPPDDETWACVEVTKSNITFKWVGAGAVISISGGTHPLPPLPDHLNYCFVNKLATAPTNVSFEGLTFDLNRGSGAANNHRGILAVATTGLNVRGCKFTSTVKGSYAITQKRRVILWLA